MHFLLRITVPLLLAGTSAADVFVVDANGGPGADFSDLPEAVASPAVAGGDTLLVRSGSYNGFSTNKGISIIEENGPATVTGLTTIHDLPAGPWFSLENLDLRRVLVTGCVGVVFIEGASMRTVRIADSEDVRLRGSAIHDPSWLYDGADGADAMVIEGDSSVELVECVLEGQTGADGDGIDAGDGGAGLSILDVATVHAALSSLTGGDGGWQENPWYGSTVGDGGHGIEVGPHAELIVSGLPSNVIWGGLGGWDDYAGSGMDGYAIWNSGAARVSGVTLGSWTGIWNTGYLEQPADPDPVLTFTRLLDGEMHVEIHGAPGGNVRLFLGTEPTQSTTGSLEKPGMIAPLRGVALGIIGSSGSITYDWNSGPFKAAFAVGFGMRAPLLLQASVVTGGVGMFSNSGTRMRR